MSDWFVLVCKVKEGPELLCKLSVENVPSSQVIGNQAGLTKALTNLVRLDFISLTTSCYNQSSVKTKGRLPLENLRFLMDSSFESINAKKGGVPQ